MKSVMKFIGSIKTGEELVAASIVHKMKELC